MAKFDIEIISEKEPMIVAIDQRLLVDRMDPGFWRPTALKVIIILPEGIFANSNLRHVREWLIRNFILHAVIGLPRDVFKHTGTTAKTAILYLENHKPNPNHKTFLAEVSEVKLDANNNSQLEAVLKAFRCRSKSGEL